MPYYEPQVGALHFQSYLPATTSLRRWLPNRLSHRGFTLVELLAAMVVLALLMSIIFGIFNQASKAWILAESRTENFQGTRAVLDLMCRELEGAIVGVHTNNTSPTTYTRLPVVTFKDSGNATVINNLGTSSDRPFSTTYTSLSPTAPNDAIFFVTQAPDSLNSGSYIDLAECGYFVGFATANTGGVPHGRYALMRHYARSGPSAPVSWDFLSNPTGWWATGGVGGADQNITTPVLDNVIRFELRYEYVDPTNAYQTNGTTSVENWNQYGGFGPTSSVVPDPTTQLPRAFHLRLSVMDRRYAARMAVILNNASLGADLSKVPYDMDTISNAAVQRTLKEGMRTFFRTVHPRGTL